MADADRIADYIVSLEKGYGKLCEDIAREARRNHVPIIRPETAAFLRTMVTAVQPARILEIGTAVGYSALLMAQVMPEDAEIITIENYAPRVCLAREHFCQAGMEYLSWLPRVLELMGTGAMLFSDNVFQDGDIFESRFAVERRERTIHGRMREYLYELKHSAKLETAILPVGDGVAVSVKRGQHTPFFMEERQQIEKG